nr:hypothetical protein [Bacillaceae bacterium JMAK1]
MLSYNYFARHNGVIGGERTRDKLIIVKAHLDDMNVKNEQRR